MAKLTWDVVGERLYETGVSNVALYVYDNNAYGKGVAWNGVTSINENPSGATANPLYADNIKYLNLISKEDFGATIQAYTYPTEFEVCDGSAELVTGVKIGQQSRKSFGLVYKTKIGNDTEGTNYGYKLHIVYGCFAAPSQKEYNTINENPDAISFSWDVSTTPVEVTGFEPTAHLEIDSTAVGSAKMATLEAKLYGDSSSEAELLLPDAIKALLTA